MAAPDATTDASAADSSAGDDASDAELDGGGDATCDALVTCYPDLDNDTYPSLGPSIMACACPDKTTERDPAGALDCNDDNADAFPTAPAFHATASCVPGPSCPKPYDYDCNGIEEPKLAFVFGGCGSFSNGCVGEGWATAVPACGESASYVACSPGAALKCLQTATMRTQECR